MCVRLYDDRVDALEALREGVSSDSQWRQTRAIRDLDRASRELLAHMLSMQRQLPPSHR